MKILDGLKKIKLLQKKVDKNVQRIADNCCSFEGEDPVHDIRVMIQSHSDLVLEINDIRAKIQRTNSSTKIDEDKYKNHTIASLITYRQVVLPQKIEILKSLSKARKENEGRYDQQKRKVVLHYNPKNRDLSIDEYEDDLTEIDSILDKYNMATDLI